MKYTDHMGLVTDRVACEVFGWNIMEYTTLCRERLMYLTWFLREVQLVSSSYNSVASLLIAQSN